MNYKPDWEPEGPLLSLYVAGSILSALWTVYNLYFLVTA